MLGHERLDQVWKAGRQRYTESLHVHSYNSLDFILLKNQAESSWSAVQMYEWEGQLELLESITSKSYTAHTLPPFPWLQKNCKLISAQCLHPSRFCLQEEACAVTAEQILSRKKCRAQIHSNPQIIWLGDTTWYHFHIHFLQPTRSW